MNIDELREQVAALKDEVTALSEADVPSDADEARSLEENLEAKMTEFETRKAELDKAEARAARLENIRSAAVNPANRTSGDGAKTINVNLNRESNIYDLSDLRGADKETRKAELTARAERAIEAFPRSVRAEARESAQRLIENPDIAEHILRTGSPAYVRGFNKWLANPVMPLLSDEERTALNEGTTTQGGFLVPPYLDPTIILTNAGTTNPFRQISNVMSITTQTWKGVTSAGVTAEWLAEATEAADASPTIAQPSITPQKAAAYVQASFEFIEDTNFASQLGRLLADARDRLESTAFAVGSGSGQPKGIVTALQAVTASRVNSNTNGAYGAVDVFAMDNSMSPRFRPNASWVANKSVWNLTRQFATGSGPQYAFWADFGGGRPAELIGYPVYESSAMQAAPLSTATASNDDIIVLADFSEYYIVDRVGVSLAYNPLVIGSNRRPTGEVGWFMHWRVGADLPVTDAGRLLRV